MNPVENYIYKQTANQRDILIFFHKIFESQPEITTSLKWGIPMYSAHRMIVYLNRDIKLNGVHVCFFNGIQLAKKNKILEIKGRKMVASVYIENLTSIPYEAIANCIQEAITLDQEIYNTKKQTNGI